MSYQSIEELLPQAGNSVYRLVRMAANRALELSEGRPKLIQKASSDKTATIALEEIRDAKVVYKGVSEKYNKYNKDRKNNKNANQHLEDSVLIEDKVYK